MTVTQSFKLGFLSRCAAAGLTEPQMLKAAEDAAGLLKTAIVGEAISGAMNMAGKVLGPMASYGIPFALLAPPVIGGAAGYGLAKATDISDRDVDDIKNDELIDELEHQSQKLNRHRTLRDLMAKPSRGSRPLM